MAVFDVSSLFNTIKSVNEETGHIPEGTPTYTSPGVDLFATERSTENVDLWGNTRTPKNRDISQIFANQGLTDLETLERNRAQQEHIQSEILKANAMNAIQADKARTTYENNIKSVNKTNMSQAFNKDLSSLGGSVMGIGAKAGAALFGAMMADTTKQVGNSEANFGYLGHLQPYYVIKRKIPYPDDRKGIGSTRGFPSNEYVKLGNLKGFTRVKEVHLKIKGATEEEIVEIEALLKKGVIL